MQEPEYIERCSGYDVLHLYRHYHCESLAAHFRAQLDTSVPLQIYGKPFQKTTKVSALSGSF